MTWIIDKHGVTYTPLRYQVARTRYLETRLGLPEFLNWPLHLADKEWVDLLEFEHVYRRAIELHLEPEVRPIEEMITRSFAEAHRLRESWW